ncbi:TfoX/Sxy family protein [Rhizobium sp. AQ_MP]|uniref:TfoX/Sxy family protein n=1 Tax=Rhizobium sp. AQ_MP TaxID=2761536 RepID=UPI00163A8DF7|nr:TfoX/Sxy family protein [Rhizobium sp. AQ_MP]MBC2773302.1 TfoX/Sxy family protein [Rhizobium sp. AQ_MP]
MDNAAIEDMFESVGPVTIRRMFGGKGIYARGIIFAVELRGELMFKGDDESAPLLEEAGARRWHYEGKSGKPVAMPYWTIPDEALDDPDLMAKWARIALDAAIRVTAREASQRK